MGSGAAAGPRGRQCDGIVTARGRFKMTADGEETPLTGREGVRISDSMELLALMARDFATTRNIEKTLSAALHHICSYVGAEAGALFLLDDARDNLRCHASVGPTDIRGLSIAADKGVVGRCISTNACSIVRDVRRDSAFNESVDMKTGFTTRSILCAPMSVKDERIGAIELLNKRGGDGLFDHADMNLLNALAASAALAILNARLAAELMEQERTRRELELAAEIQRSLLPPTPAEDFPAHGINRPARTVSGDFYDFYALPDGRICFALGDVSGKGMNAALLMAKAASLFRCLGKTATDPGRLLAQINGEITETAARGMFITMVTGIYDPTTGRVRLANAGHEPALFHGVDGTVSAYGADAPPVGVAPPEMFGADGFPEAEIDLAGGTLYVFTDGVTEGYLADGSELGSAGFSALVARHRDEPVGRRLEAVCGAIARADEALRDDLTVLAIDDAAAAAVRRASPTAPAVPAKGLESGIRLLDVRFPAEPDRLKLVRGAVAELARLNGCSEGVSRDIVIAVDEACQNIIRHAYCGAPGEEIVLHVHRRGQDLIFTLEDFAPTIDPATVKPRDLDDVRPGGIGTHLMREVMDEVGFLPPPGDTGNILRMVKRIE